MNGHPPDRTALARDAHRVIDVTMAGELPWPDTSEQDVTWRLSYQSGEETREMLNRTQTALDREFGVRFGRALVRVGSHPHVAFAAALPSGMVLAIEIPAEHEIVGGRSLRRIRLAAVPPRCRASELAVL